VVHVVLGVSNAKRLRAVPANAAGNHLAAFQSEFRKGNIFQRWERI